MISTTYLWLKAGQIIFVIFWMARLFMLPRYFVYHQEAPEGSPENAVWIERERRLLRIILWPAMAVSWLLGLALAYYTGAFAQGWFHAKLGFVLILSAYHVWLAGYHEGLKQGVRKLSGKKLRMLNEVPGLAATLIVIMVVLRPF